MALSILPISFSLSLTDILILIPVICLSIYYLLNQSSSSSSSPSRSFPFSIFSSSSSNGKKSSLLINRNDGNVSSNNSNSQSDKLVNQRDFLAKMDSQNKKIIVFYGSQTGTAEDYATRLAKEAKSRFGLSSLVADPDDYDFENLDQVTSEKLIVFVLATYGEGEPTDNAVAMFDFLKEESNCEDLSNLRYVIFALGDRTYEQFCATGKLVDKFLSDRGARRLGELGMGDDDKSMEEDYLAWKDPVWEEVQKGMGWEEGKGGDEADFEIKEIDPQNPAMELQVKESQIYRGELSARALVGTRGVIDAKNPFPARIVEAKELFEAGDRNCVHMEFDIKDTGIRYQAGDHLAVWPMNPDSEVERLMKILGLWEKRDVGVQISSLDPMLAKVPFPSPTSYDAIFRNYLDISSTVSRQLLASLARFAPTPKSAETLKALGTDKELYMSKVASLGLRLGETLMMVSGEDCKEDEGYSLLSKEDPLNESFGKGWLNQWKIPFDRIISGLPRLQPRFYSISSSPKLYPDHIHITAVVLKYPSGDRTIYGCATNYLLNAKMELHGEHSRMDHQQIDQRLSGGRPKYRLEGPRGKYLVEADDSSARILKLPIHVRRSNFRLPTSPKVPMIMIGPGTGVAPFRSFVQERVGLARKTRQKFKELGKGDEAEALNDWARMILFYGCRNEDQDFLYKHEWDGYAKELGGKFEMYTAISRKPEFEGKRKEYVQDLIKLRSGELKRMIVDQKGYIFICGDGKNMLRGVEEVLKDEVFNRFGLDGNHELKFLKDRNRLLLDVWS